jgi:cytoskeletal protein CcmA (bactofilin family)
MPIFRRDPPAGRAASATATSSGEVAGGAGRGTVTLIAPGTKVKGEVTGMTELQIAGELEGEVKVEALVVIGAGGAVTGPVHGRVVRVAGRVAGNVTGAERVEVGAGGSVEGDIAAPRVVIAEGAFFKGTIEMRSDQDQELRRPGRASAEAVATTPRAGNAADPAHAAQGAQGALAVDGAAEAGSK